MPIAYGFNSYFTKRVLGIANAQMLRRGMVVQPLIRLYKLEPSLDRTVVIKTLISVVEAGDPDGWSKEQMDVLRYCQSALSLRDEDLAELDEFFEREIDDVLDELPGMNPKARQELVQICTIAAALAVDDRHDVEYSLALSKLSQGADKPVDVRDAATAIRKTRKTFT